MKGKNKELKIEAKKKEAVIESFNLWMKSNDELPHQYEVIDVSYRIAGTGSLGTERYLILIRQVKDTKKFRLIDMKQANPSSLLPYVDTVQPVWNTEAERVVSVQKRMQNITPALLSPHNYNENSYVIQEMQPTKDRINFELIGNNEKQICSVMKDMGVIAASAYFNCSGRQGSAIADELISFGENKDWHHTIIDYAKNYMLTTTKYYKDFMSDYLAGFSS